MSSKVIIDADPGIGDAIAIAVALLDPDLEIVGITPTAGCVSGEAATRNVQALIEHLDPPRWPRVGHSTGTAPIGTADLGTGDIRMTDLHGPSGLGDWEFRVADLARQHESAKLMIDIVRGAPNEVTLLALGPLTNIELACERFPGFLGLLKGLVFAGGSIANGGDITAAAEFNVYANPEAAQTVLTSPATKIMVPLDVSRQHVLTFDQFDRIKAGTSAAVTTLLDSMLPFAFRAHHQHLGIEGVALTEIVALAAIAHPRLFDRESMAVDVETTGSLTRGMTVFDRRGIPHWQTNIEVLTDVDAQGVTDYMTRVLTR